MQTIVYINPLKSGKLEEYKVFSATNTGPRKKEYADMLKRYGLKNAKVYYHKLDNKELIVVIHDAEIDAAERIKNFTTSTNPYDQWFLEQLNKFHDFNASESLTECLFSFDY